MNVSILGCGRWGTFISWYLSNHNHSVFQWGRENSQIFNSLASSRKNEFVTLDERVILTNDLKKSIEHAEVIIISISSQGLRGLMEQIVKHDVSDKIFLLCMKGVEVDSGKRLTEVVCDFGISPDKIAVWVGPGHIQAFTQGLPNCMLIDSLNKDLTIYLADSFRSELIRFYYGDDLIGTEIGAAAKNVMGIAAGMLDGGGYSTLKGPLMARGAREISRLTKALGGNELSAYGLCHLGDYETTLFSPYSNNRRFGEDYVKGVPFKKLAEGVSTAKALKELGDKYNVDLPITNAVYSILYNNANPMDEFLHLFSRSSRKEF